MTKRKRVLLLIGQIAEMFNVSVAKINYYINRGLIKSVSKSKAGYRQFDPDDVGDRLERIGRLKSAGKTIEEIEKILNRKRRR